MMDNPWVATLVAVVGIGAFSLLALAVFVLPQYLFQLFWRAIGNPGSLYRTDERRGQPRYRGPGDGLYDNFPG